MNDNQLFISHELEANGWGKFASLFPLVFGIWHKSSSSGSRISVRDAWKMVMGL